MSSVKRMSFRLVSICYINVTVPFHGEVFESKQSNIMKYIQHSFETLWSILNILQYIQHYEVYSTFIKNIMKCI